MISMRKRTRIKNLINSIISNANKGTRFACADAKDHFLDTSMQNPEHMKVKHEHLLSDISRFKE